MVNTVHDWSLTPADNAAIDSGMLMRSPDPQDQIIINAVRTMMARMRQFAGAGPLGVMNFTTITSGSAFIADSGGIAVTGAFNHLGDYNLSGLLNLTEGQIKFPAVQNPSADANTLDDYEEGTFTPAFSATGSTFNHTTQSGRYTKIGRFVFCVIAIIIGTSGNTLTANTLTFTGLPFTVNGSEASPFGIRWVFSTTSYIGMNLRLIAGTTTAAIEGWTAATNANSAALLADDALHVTSGSSMRTVAIYQI